MYIYASHILISLSLFLSLSLYIYIYIYTYIHTYIHTYTHIYSFARWKLQKLLQKHRKCIQIQSIARMRRAKTAFTHYKRVYMHSSISIQSAVRVYIAYKCFKRKKKRFQSIRTIQTIGRVIVAMKCVLKKEQKARGNAAVIIQCAMRCRKAVDVRKALWYQHYLLVEQSANVIQRYL